MLSGTNLVFAGCLQIWVWRHDASGSKPSAGALRFWQDRPEPPGLMTVNMGARLSAWGGIMCDAPPRFRANPKRDTRPAPFCSGSIHGGLVGNSAQTDEAEMHSAEFNFPF